MGARINNRLANFGAELDDRLVHLRLDLLFEHNLAALENFLNMRPQLARLRIDNREFLLDTEGKRVVLVLMQGRKSPPETTRCHPESRRRRWT